jgi:putative PIN family toxin of toxin-antitoxin system
MPLRIVLDTNVLVSGLLFGGPPRVLLQCALEGSVELATSSDLTAELERVLKAKFPERLQAIRDTLDALSRLTVPVVPGEVIEVISEDPSDNRVLECAVSAQADAIVSGDKHLLHLKVFRGMPILAPQAFLAQWRLKRHH